MNLNTRAYLRRYGVSDPVIAELESGRLVAIDAEGITSWLRGAFESGSLVTKSKLAHALWPEIEKAVQLARAEGFSEGYDANKAELLRAEAPADKWGDELHDLKARYKALERGLEDFADVAADVHCWLDGVSLGLRMAPGDWTRSDPWFPSLERVRALSAVLKGLRAPPEQDDEIPF